MRSRFGWILSASFILLLLVLPAGLSGCGSEGGTAVTSDAEQASSAAVALEGPLAFPSDDYTVQTAALPTADGEKEVTYHFYSHLTYVADPVDPDFQSLNVSVPVEIDGVEVDASDAPILFEVRVGGYAPVMCVDSYPAHRALAAGYVVVTPGCRGSSNVAEDGTFFGKAPAAIVDLKAAVRYLRYNDAVLPGNAEWTITTGSSAGGALSALLGASGDEAAYEPYLDGLGAADTSDAVYASACFCPITDLDHADMIYEWEFGAIPMNSDGSLVDQTLSAELAAAFTEYQAELKLEGRDGFGGLSAENYGDYLLQEYLIPSAEKYLSSLSDAERSEYLADKGWLAWEDGVATFTWDDYLAYLGRMKGLPAFDAFANQSLENRLFGSTTEDYRHFTDFGLQQTSGDPSVAVDPDLAEIVGLMNPMPFLADDSEGCVEHWWIRHGTRDAHTGLPVIINLATILENLGKNVDTQLYWDGNHGADEDPNDFIAWIGTITGYED